MKTINITGIVGAGLALGLGVAFTQGWVNPDDFGLAAGFVGGIMGGFAVGQRVQPPSGGGSA